MPLLVAASTPAWITAVSVLILAIVVASLAGWHVRMNGFRPHCAAKIDTRRQAMLLQVQNRGSVDGEITRIELLDASGLASRRAVVVEGYNDGRFEATALPARAAMRLIIKPPVDLDSFPPRTYIRVVWIGGVKALAPPQDDDADYAGMASTLPLGRNERHAEAQ
jgi:hypothetical protein